MLGRFSRHAGINSDFLLYFNQKKSKRIEEGMNLFWSESILFSAFFLYSLKIMSHTGAVHPTFGEMLI